MLGKEPVGEKQLRVLIVDDEAINRLGLKCLLADLPGVEVVAEATNGTEALELSSLHDPDVILMDVSMPELDGIAAVRAIRNISARVKILMLTSRSSGQDVSEALAAGANGYCLKNSNTEQFKTALEVISAGNTYLDSKVMPQLLTGLLKPSGGETKAPAKTHNNVLSESELELLSMRMNGLNDEETAKRFNMSSAALKNLEEQIKLKIVKLGSSSISNNSRQTLVCSQCNTFFPLGTQHCSFDGAPLVPETVINRLGTMLEGKYEILDFIGRGGGAIVYKAHHRYLNHFLAVKIIHSELSTDFTMLQRFREEAELASKLQHPNVVKVFDFGLTEAGTPYLVMEFLEGENLEMYLRARGKLDLDEFISIFKQVAEAVAYAHSKGLVHRDVKPSNIFLCKVATGVPLVKLVDFGLAKAFNSKQKSRLTAYGQIIGTPGYMSPEICRGEKDSVASDIYAFGCSMYECLTGALPFVGESSMETMFKHIREDVPAVYPDGHTSFREARLAAIITRCLQKNPESRFQSVQELFTELTSFG